MKIIKELPKIPFWSGVGLLVIGLFLLGIRCVSPELLPTAASELLIDGIICIIIGSTAIGIAIHEWWENSKKK